MVTCPTCHSESVLLQGAECFCTFCGARNPIPTADTEQLRRLYEHLKVDNLKHAIESIDGLRARIKFTESFETEVFERKQAEEKVMDLRQEMTQTVDALEERMSDLRHEADMARMQAEWDRNTDG